MSCWRCCLNRVSCSNAADGSSESRLLLLKVNLGGVVIQECSVPPVLIQWANYEKFTKLPQNLLRSPSAFHAFDFHAPAQQWKIDCAAINCAAHGGDVTGRLCVEGVGSLKDPFCLSRILQVFCKPK